MRGKKIKRGSKIRGKGREREERRGKGKENK